MTRILPHDHEHRLRHPRGPRRPDPRSAGRRRHDADLPDLHLRPGRAGPAQGLRVRPHPESDPRGAGAQRGEPRRRPPTASRSAPGSPRSTRVLKLLQAGDHVVCGENVYGGTHRLMERIYAQLGLTFTFVDMRDDRPTSSGRSPRRRGWSTARRPTNPMMNLVDLAAVGDLTQAHGLPLRRGQHLRHAVLPAAARVRRRHRAPLDHQVPERPQRHGRRACWSRAATTWPSGSASSRTRPAACPGPMDCWLALRGIKTLPLRMRQHDANGRRVAEWLAAPARRDRGCTIPGSRRIRSTSSPAGR